MPYATIPRYRLKQMFGRLKLVRRTRKIGEHQSKLGRFLALRKPWNDLAGTLTNRRLNIHRRHSVRPWSVWRCQLDRLL